jgi:hypothetical protein
MIFDSRGRALPCASGSLVPNGLPKNAGKMPFEAQGKPALLDVRAHLPGDGVNFARGQCSARALARRELA